MQTTVWPQTTCRTTTGAIAIGGVSLTDIARDYGTPTYIYDDATMRMSMRDWRSAMAAHLPGGRVVYAAKAFLALGLVPILSQEGLGLDAVSAGELQIGLAGGMDPQRISLHGNAKTRDDLTMALDHGIGKIIVDNLDEIDLLAELTAGRAGDPMLVLLRVNPGVDVHTHRMISTGVADSRFGLPIVTGQAEEAVRRLMALPGLRFGGYHAHVGSQLLDASSQVAAVGVMLRFAAEMRDRHGAPLEHLSPGGGLGISYIDEKPLSPDAWLGQIADAIRAGCAEHGLQLPIVTIEPGRSIIGRAGVALYTVVSRKHIPQLRSYVSVDGGMADNIRPALYGAAYTAELASRFSDDPPEKVTIAGRYCESGDVLIEAISLPPLVPDDLLAIPGAGAYCLAMASNYNMSRRPAVVLVHNGQVQVLRQRESLADLLRNDHPILQEGESR